MATLTINDLLKRNNLEIFSRRVSDKEAFTVDGKEYQATGVVWLGEINQIGLTSKQLCSWIDARKTKEQLKIELDQLGTVPLNRLFKDKEFGGVAGKSSETGSERQEIGLIEALTKAAELKLPLPNISITIQTAYKNFGQSKAGKEPYADIIMHDFSGNRLGVSCKGNAAASLAGGGIVGLSHVVPDLIQNSYALTVNYLKNDLKLSQNDLVSVDFVPDLFIRIPETSIRTILVGNEYIGGPIDYMYVGKMNVKYEVSGEELKLNGNFYDIDSYIEKVGSFFFRIRKRDLDASRTIRINYTKTDKNGNPILFQNPVTMQSNFRMVIDNKYSSKAVLLA